MIAIKTLARNTVTIKAAYDSRSEGSRLVAAESGRGAVPADGRGAAPSCERRGKGLTGDAARA
eukprot:6193869-Pleurochrysis_carterae.AAC.2